MKKLLLIMTNIIIFICKSQIAGATNFEELQLNKHTAKTNNKESLESYIENKQKKPESFPHVDAKTDKNQQNCKSNKLLDAITFSLGMSIFAGIVETFFKVPPSTSTTPSLPVFQNSPDTWS